ncbi:MAG: hypothetical protein M1812_006206 [Candelaria pacifica]|nr:MAG: hypothetical protein M1812_006206 [Candelaria pacifica]
MRSAFLLLFAFFASVIIANPLSRSSKRSILKRNNINKFEGCDKGQKAAVYEAYKDALSMADNVQPFMQNFNVPESLSPGVPEAGPLEKRFFGADIDSSFDAKPALIRTVINNIHNWYAWGIFDWVFGERIEVYCQDVPNTLNLQCITQIGNSAQRIGAYALSEKSSQIVFCPPFFDHPTLAEVTTNLKNDKTIAKNPFHMKSRAHIFFHEMTHLARITETSTVVVKDLPANPEQGLGALAYGPRLTEKLARRFPAYAGNNADNIAWYATTKWFEKVLGVTPDPTEFSLTDNDEAIGKGPDLQILDAVGGDPEDDFASTGYLPDTDQIDDELSYAAANFKNFPGTLTIHPSSQITNAPAAPPPAMAGPAPSQVKSNCQGSGYCPLIKQSDCEAAYNQYEDATKYTQRTSRVSNHNYGGCAAIFVCSDDASYAAGMLGSQIKMA